MEPSRPFASRRLLRAIEAALGRDGSITPLSLAELPKKMGVLSQEKRFLTFTFLLHAPSALTSQEIAEAIKDQHSNVLRNLHVLTAENLLVVEQDPVTSIYRYAINRITVGQIVAYFTVT
ncbi:hypothetical protein BK022_04655 [Methylorubrum extorquens]|uniref:HTH arsR-type domain-containing protein n=1 Tax=Methylorubrum extorquens TaxID=408 RepID=A0A1S1P8R7_METEX|nr:hypothetical protein BK022_04655 [Methylorubrum extorquens]